MQSALFMIMMQRLKSPTPPTNLVCVSLYILYILDQTFV